MILVWQRVRTRQRPEAFARGAVSESDLCSGPWSYISFRSCRMAHTHEFDCKLCGAHLDSRQELDKHTKDKHPNESRSAQSGMDSSSRSSSSNDPRRTG